MSKKVLLLILILSFQNSLVACGGSCLECHPKLESYINDKDHIILKECIQCHNTPTQHGKCGQDCFDCHPKEKIYAQKDILEHQELKKCSQCHEEKPNFNLQKPTTSFTKEENLIQLFK